MNARSSRVNYHLSELDFPPIIGLGGQSDFTKTEIPTIINNKVVLKITKALIIDSDSTKEHEVLSAQSVYEIPVSEIKTKEDIYEFYKDATSFLSEAYKFVQSQLPQLPNFSFPNQPIETYEKEIGGVLYLLSSQN